MLSELNQLSASLHATYVIDLQMNMLMWEEVVFPGTNRWHFGVLSSKTKPDCVLKTKTSGTSPWILPLER